MEEKRSKYIIEKEFQYSFIKSTLLIVVATSFLFASSQILFFYRMKGYGEKAGLEKSSVYFQFIEDLQSQMMFIGILFFVFLTIITLAWALKFSNRIAGPLYRLKLDLQRKLNGEVFTIKFRDNDYFKDIAPLIEKVLINESQVSVPPIDHDHSDDLTKTKL